MTVPTPLTRPLLHAIRVLPRRWRDSVYYRTVHPLRDDHADLYSAASLKYAPGVAMRLLVGDDAHSPIAALGYYEPGLSRRIVEVGAGGGLMVDVGANVGYFSLLWASQGAASRVLALEPSPRNVEILRGNVESNGLADRIEIRPIAAGREDGSLSLYLGPDSQTGWGSFSESVGGRSIAVDVVRLDDVLNERVRMLKIDTEGADTWVLEGARRLLQERMIDEIHFEHLKRRARALGIGDDDARSLLESVGYHVEATNDEGGGLVNYTARPAA